jgi:pimeloyl-ACP methyl ester carboxylesterase
MTTEAGTMGASFVMIPGAGGMAWCWGGVPERLKSAGREAIAVDLPGDDERLGLADYADIVVRAIGERSNVVLVAQSLGGFTAPLVCARTPVRMLILVNAMIPLPGETPGSWFENTGAAEARAAAARDGGYSAQFDAPTYFLHDVPAAVLRDGPSQPRPQANSTFAEPCRFERWPSIPIRVVASADDRFFPLDFQKRVARDRLNVDPETLPGGHLVALSNCEGLTDLLLRLAHVNSADGAAAGDFRTEA